MQQQQQQQQKQQQQQQQQKQKQKHWNKLALTFSSWLQQFFLTAIKLVQTDSRGFQRQQEVGCDSQEA